MILGLDISTSVIGVCVLDNNIVVKTDYIDLRKVKGLFHKAQVVEEYFHSLDFNIEHVFIEQALMFFRSGGSTAKTMAVLQRFNGVVSWQCFKQFNIIPEYISPISARSKCGIKVLRGKKAKEVVMEHFLAKDTPEFEIVKTRYGNIQTYCYDIADAIVVARAGHYLLQESHKNAKNY